MSVYGERRKRMQQTMRGQGIHYLLLAPSSDLFYLAGHRTHLTPRLTLFILPADGAPMMVIPELEAPLAAGIGDDVAMHPWPDGDDPYRLAQTLLPLRQAITCALDDHMWGMHVLRLQQALPKASWRLAATILAPARQQKDAAEIALLRQAALWADAAMAAIRAQPLIGRSEREVGRQIDDLLLEMGHESVNFCTVASGPNSASPHHVISERIITEGDAVVLDFGGSNQGYGSDITRSFFIGAGAGAGAGEPPQEYRTIYDAVQRANEAAFRAVQPGVPCQEIDRVARKVIRDAGYDRYFVHRTGHGIGLDGHEPPFMVEGNETPLAPGMAFSIEPGIYLPGQYGVRIEDIVICTETGGERLNAAPRALGPAAR